VTLSQEQSSPSLSAPKSFWFVSLRDYFWLIAGGLLPGAMILGGVNLTHFRIQDLESERFFAVSKRT
jgi:hypothetical protein